MKLYKYFFTLLVLAIGVVFATECEINIRTSQKCKYPYMKCDFMTDDTRKEVISDALNISQKCGVKIFMYDCVQTSTYEQDNNIFVPNGYESEIKEKLNIEYDELKSLSSGKYKFNIKSLNDNINELSFTSCIYIIGDDNNVQSFVKDFKEQYKASNYNEVYPDAFKEFKLLLFGAWAFVIMIIATFFFYDAITRQKELVINHTLGNSIYMAVMKACIIDFVILAAEFALVIFALNSFVTTKTVIQNAAIVYAVLCVIIVIANILVLFKNKKNIMAGNRNGGKLIKYNYMLKIVAVAALCISSVSVINLIIENKNGIETEKTLNEYFSGYDYVDFYQGLTDNSPNENGPKTVTNDLYYEYYNELKPLKLTCSNVDMKDNSYISANEFALPYLYSVLPSLKDINLSNGKWMIFPDSVPKTTVYKERKYYAKMEKRGEEHVNFTFYTGNADVLFIHASTDTKTGYIHNPVISLDLGRPEKGSREEAHTFLTTDDVIDSVCQKYSLNKPAVTITKVVDAYNYSWGIIRSEIYSGILIALIMLAMNGVLIFSILKIDFSLNAKEYCVKKIIGYSFISKYKKILITNIVLYAVSYYISIKFLGRMDIVGQKMWAAGILAGMLILDIILTIIKICLLEKANIQKILKGGAL